MEQMIKNGYVIEEDGSYRWYQNGFLHREDGPALEFVDGTRYWYQNGELHRTDGPAAEWPDGAYSWHLNNRRYSFDEYVDQLYPNDCSKKTHFILKWSSR